MQSVVGKRESGGRGWGYMYRGFESRTPAFGKCLDVHNVHKHVYMILLLFLSIVALCDTFLSCLTTARSC